MKTLLQIDNGDRLVLLTRDEFDGLATATDIAYQDPDCVPEPLREIGDALWRAFHSDAATAQDERAHARAIPAEAVAFERLGQRLSSDPSSLDDDSAQARAIASGGALTPEDVIAVSREAEIEREKERLGAIHAAADRVIKALPREVAGWERSFDMGGAVSWSRDDDRVVYATPNWEGIAGTPVSVDEVDGDQPYGVLPFDATRYVDRPVEVAVLDYLALLLPVLARVGRSVEIKLDGIRPLRLLPWPENGCYLGVMFGGSPTLISAPMHADGSCERDCWGEVSNVEGFDLRAVNAFFGTTFTVDEFSGR
jgi:hypothetical protein